MSKIPKANKASKKIIPPSNRKSLLTTTDGILFSFEALERTEYFNLDGTCNNWHSDLLDMMKEISKHSNKELIDGKFRKYRIHNHEGANPPSPLPEGVELKDCYQIRISKSKGGIHGIFRENVFYVIWLDPLHNMYPDDRYGGLRKVKVPNTCCKDRDEEILELDEEILELKEQLKKLKEENELYQELFEQVNDN